MRPRVLPVVLAVAAFTALTAAAAPERDARAEAWHESMRHLRAAEEAFARGDWAAAEEGYGLARAASAPLGTRSLPYGRSIDGLARVYDRTDRLDAAAAHFTEALAVWRELLGEDQPGVATAMHNLAACYIRQDRLDEADVLLRHSIEIWRRHLETRRRELAISLRARAAIHQKRGEWSLADELIAEAASIAGN